MLSIWIGRAGSGKSRRILDAIEQNRSLRGQILLVPEHISHEAEVDLCRRCGATASRDAEVLSFRSLSTRVLTECGGLAEFTLDNGGKILTMRRCLQELHSQLKVFGKPSRRAAFLEQLVTLADELYAYDISPAALWAQVEDMEGAMGDKLRDVALIFAAYDARLHTADFDERSRMQKLCEALPESCYLRGKDLYLDGFSFFNKLEETAVRTALRQCSNVTVALLGDKYDANLFKNAVQQRERLARIAREMGIPCEILYIQDEPQGALGHLERHFFGTDKRWEEQTDAITLYEAGTAYTEVEYASAQIRALVGSGEYRYRDIAVSARNMEVYAPLLETVFDRDGIPAYISRRSDILEKPVLTLLLSAVDAVTGGFEYEDMFHYLKTGMAGITPQECDLLENYVIRWEIRGNMWLRDTVWSANPDGYGVEMNAARTERLAEINRIREKVRLPLLQLSEGLKAAETAGGKAEALYRFAERSGVPEALKERSDALLESGRVQLAEEYRQLWQIFCEVLDQFVEILGDMELSGEEFARLLRLVLTQYSVGTIPATLDQVKVSEITRNDRHKVRYLFLLGANDHVLPQVGGNGGILDDEDRAALQQREILLSGATFDELDNELQNIYACLAQPTEHLHISWPTTDLNGSELRPSFVVERIEKLFPAVKRRCEDGAYRLTVPATALAVAGQEPEGAMWRYFAASGQYADVLAGMERARAMRRGKLSPQAVESLYGRHISMSASRMDTAKKCHFRYFMEYGLKAKERTRAGFEAPEIGTFIHYLLENVTRDVMEQGGYAAVDSDTLRRLVKHYVDQYIETEFPDYGEKSARFRYLFGRLRKAAYTTIENIAAELRESDFRPMAFELGFGGKDGELPAITVREGDTTLSVSGKVDRVDGWIHDGKLYLRVVDYKTGKKAFDLTDVRYGLGIQMLLYLFTLQNEGEAYFGHPVVPAGVMYLPARDIILREKRDISEEKLKAALDKTLRRSGMVLSEPEVLRAMEHSALESPCYLPIGVSKDGKISGGIATAAQLGKLGQYVERLLHKIAQEIGGGNVDADPCSRTPQDIACSHCPYISACYFEEGRDKRRYLQRTDAENFWPFIEKEAEVAHGN